LTIYVEFGCKVTEYDRWKNRRRMAWICMVAAIGIDQSKLVPLLTAALQDAIKRIEALEAQLNT